MKELSDNDAECLKKGEKIFTVKIEVFGHL
jgi:hypothetical protein